MRTVHGGSGRLSSFPLADAISIPVQWRGAKSFADDLGVSRGVVLSRAATILRSIETKPCDWKICPPQKGESCRSVFGGDRVSEGFLFSLSLRLEQGQCNDPDCPPLTTTSLGPVVFSSNLASLHWPSGACASGGVGQITRRLPRVPTCALRSSPSLTLGGGCVLESKRWRAKGAVPSLGSHGGSDRDVRVNGARRGSLHTERESRASEWGR